MFHISSIDREVCQDARLVGAKAARLAQARARGFPVPDAVVVHCSASVPVLGAAASMIETRGLHFGRFEVMSASRDELSVLAHAVAWLGEPLAVRSSSPLEDDPRLAGAFTSYLGVSPADVITAVLGVWSSALRQPFEDDDEENMRAHGSTPTMGVIIQREISPAFAGTASVVNGEVRVVAVAGSAASLMAGWSTGISLTVDDSGEVHSLGAAAALDSLAIKVAKLARGVHAALGDSLIEWAYADGQVWLLQSRVTQVQAAAGRAWATRPAPPPVTAPGSARAADAERVLVAAGRPGDLAERCWLPWAIVAEGCGEGSGPRATPLADPIAVWEKLLAEASTLTRSVWGQGVDVAMVGERLTAMLFAGGAETFDMMAGLGRPDREQIAAFERLASALIGHLLARGVINSALDFWALPAELTHVLEAGLSVAKVTARTKRAALKWEALLYESVAATGHARSGLGVSDGMGCGRAAVVDVFGFESGVEAQGLPARSVLVAARPLPRYAPLLMGAAGLVTAGGSEAAHLIEVARSLGIPAVLNCDITDIGADGESFVAIDGSLGIVHVRKPDRAQHRLAMAQPSRTVVPKSGPKGPRVNRNSS